MPKIRIVFLFFLFVFIAIVVKLFFVQVLSIGTTAQNYLKYKKITPSRGLIYDRNHEVLALNKKTYLL